MANGGPKPRRHVTLTAHALERIRRTISETAVARETGGALLGHRRDGGDRH